MLRDSLLDALAVLLPVDCPACGRPVVRVPCDDCAEALAALPTPPVRLLGPPGRPLVVTSGAPYTGVVRRLVVALKEEGRSDAAGALAARLRPALAHALDGRAATLVAPPGSHGRRMRRGYDPVDLLVRGCGGRVARPITRTRRSVDQVGLDRRERSGNLDGAFAARRRLDGLEAVLVDDVVTSGATLLELRRAVEAAGGRVRGAVALAATGLRSVAGSSGDSRELRTRLPMNVR
ncbi:ComF family protein [Rathayibacter caricis]|uniref:ComF family protein n=1 Tax=Rathayibacter caricis TaxID=110936 RepID=UPI001FB517FD|nr:ComF family protein [Rathayibacter caricis]MCJ1695046.1 ComF family protein [Rathayibacter caricis]